MPTELKNHLELVCRFPKKRQREIAGTLARILDMEEDDDFLKIVGER